MIIRAFTIVRQFNPQARLFFAVLVGMSLVIDGIYNVLLNLYLLRLGYGTEFIGLVNAVGLLTFACASLPAGILGSRYSNTRIMKIGGVISLVGALMLPQVELLPGGMREAWLALHYALMLTGFSFFFVNGAPYLMNVVDVAHKHRAFSLKTAHWALAGFCGSLAGGILPGIIADARNMTLVDPAPYRITLTLAGLTLALAVLLLQRIRPLADEAALEVKPGGGGSARAASERFHWTTSLIVLICVMTVVRLFQVAGSATALVYFNVYMDRQLAVSTAMIGAVAAIGRLTGVPTALLTPALIRRWGLVNTVLWSSLFTSLCLLPLALVEHWLAAALGFIGSLAVMSIRFTAFTVYILDLVPRVQQSVIAGSGEMAAGLSFAMISLGGGILLSIVGFRELFLLGSLLTFIGSLLFWLHVRATAPKRKPKLAFQAPGG